jgi:hypothetical protein
MTVARRHTVIGGYEKGRSDAQKDHDIHGLEWMAETITLMEHAGLSDYGDGYISEYNQIMRSKA